MTFNRSMLAKNLKIRKRIRRKWNCLDYIRDLRDSRSKDKDKCLNKFY